MDSLHGMLAWALVVVATAAAASSALTAGTGRLAVASGHLISLTHVLVVGMGIAGLVLVAGGAGVSDPLHTRVYGPAMVLVLAAAWVYRLPDARRNFVLFALACALVAGLGARGLQTGM